jgi:phenylalanyl-tRNA synthetase beta subunit
VVLDLNVTIGERVEAGSVLGALPDLPYLVASEVADVYPLPTGARLTLRFTWNGGDRSLTAEETNASLQAVRDALAAQGFAV